jgi:hypothetical protein
LTVPQKNDYNVPRTDFELQLLKDLIKQLVNVVNMEFEEEMNWAVWDGYHSKKDTKPLKDYSKINIALKLILDDMNSTAKKLDKDYDITLQDIIG